LRDEGRIGVLHADLGHLARGNGSSDVKPELPLAAQSG